MVCEHDIAVAQPMLSLIHNGQLLAQQKIRECVCEMQNLYHWTITLPLLSYGYLHWINSPLILRNQRTLKHVFISTSVTAFSVAPTSYCVYMPWPIGEPQSVAFLALDSCSHESHPAWLLVRDDGSRHSISPGPQSPHAWCTCWEQTIAQWHSTCSACRKSHVQSLASLVQRTG